MALNINQILAASYNAVLAEARKPTNNWAESALMRELDRQGAIVHTNLGVTIQAPLDYRRNPGAVVLANDMAPVSLQKTEVITAADYAVASVSVPITWSKEDDAKNPTENQKIALVKSLIQNAIDSHDDLLEATLFTGVNSLIGLDTMITDNGQGVIGGIDSSVETWWANQQNTYTGASDIEAAMTKTWNATAKGSGSALTTKIIVSGATPQATFEGTQQAFQRYVDVEDLKAGFKTLAFKTARYVFSQYGGTRLYFLNPKSYTITVSKQYFRDMGDVSEINNANAFTRKVYSALQVTTNNRSRLGSVHL